MGKNKKRQRQANGKLSNRETEKFIELVRENPTLYDQSKKIYLDRGLKWNIFKKIAKKMDVDGFTAERALAKWKYIKDAYRNAKKEAKTTSGSSSTDKKPRWPFWQNCQFLEPHTSEASTDSNLRIDDDSGDESAGSEDPTSNDSGGSDSDENEPQASSLKPIPSLQPAAKAKAGPSAESLLQRHTSMVDKLLSDDNDEDDFFFKFCAKRIKNLTNANRSWLRMKIEQAFLEAENYQAQWIAYPSAPTPASSYNVASMNNMQNSQGASGYGQYYPTQYQHPSGFSQNIEYPGHY